MKPAAAWLKKRLGEFDERKTVHQKGLLSSMRALEKHRIPALDLVSLIKLNRAERLRNLIKKTRTSVSARHTAEVMIMYYVLRQEG